MTVESIALIVVFLAAVAVCVKPLGLYIANVMEPQPNKHGAIERLFYRVSGIDADKEMS